MLLPEQRELLEALVEASRNVPRDKRQKFLVVQTLSSPDYIIHPGLQGTRFPGYLGDVETLARAGLVALGYGSRGTPKFDVTPEGFALYEELKSRSAEPTDQVEATVIQYLDAEAFQREAPAAYVKWSEAEQLLWQADSERHFTTIGHLCREAMQEFVTALVERFKPPSVESDKALVVKRLSSTLQHLSTQRQLKSVELLQAMLGYWAEVHSIVQRQEHGGQKEGTPLTWEDARRVVFQTAIVMFEIQRSTSGLRN